MERFMFPKTSGNRSAAQLLLQVTEYAQTLKSSVEWKEPYWMSVHTEFLPTLCNLGRVNPPCWAFIPSSVYVRIFFTSCDLWRVLWFECPATLIYVNWCLPGQLKDQRGDRDYGAGGTNRNVPKIQSWQWGKCQVSRNAGLMHSRSSSVEKAMAPHSSTLAWKILWTEESGRLQSLGSLRVGHDWVT